MLNSNVIILFKLNYSLNSFVATVICYNCYHTKSKYSSVFCILYNCSVTKFNDIKTII